MNQRIAYDKLIEPVSVANHEYRESLVCEILDIFWERVFLHFIVRNTTGKSIYLRSDDESFVRLVSGPINQEDEIRLRRLYVENAMQFLPADNLYSIELNMTAACGRSFLKNAKWKIGYYKEADIFTFCTVEPTLTSRLDGLDKLFRYDSTKYAYTVDFSTIIKNRTDIFLEINSFFMRKNDYWKDDF